jgi:hypothetical protein
MSDAPETPQESSSPFGYGTDPNWDDLPRQVQVAALQQAIEVLANRGYEPISGEALFESLGSSEIRLLAQNFEFTEQELQTFSEQISNQNVEREVARIIASELQENYKSSLADRLIFASVIN